MRLIEKLCVMVVLVAGVIGTGIVCSGDDSGQRYSKIAYAARKGLVTEITVAFEKEPTLMEELQKRKIPILRDAVACDKVDVVRLLLSHGADPNWVEDAQTNTPLHVASRSASTEIVEMLLKAGANVNARVGRNSDTPLAYAALANNAKNVELLLNYKADIDAGQIQESNGKSYYITPLNMAISSTHDCSAACVLVERGAKFDVVMGGIYPIHQAVRCKQPKLVELLLVKGADANMKYGGNGVPLDDAIRVQNKAIVESLLKHGAKVEPRHLPAAEKLSNNDIIDLLEKAMGRK